MRSRGTADNTVAEGQHITMSGSGSTLGMLLGATYGPVTGTGTILYTDGSTASFTVTVPDWWGGSTPAGDQVAVTAAYQNRQGNTQYQHPAYLYSTAIALDPGKTVAQVILPAVSAGIGTTPVLHVFALSVS